MPFLVQNCWTLRCTCKSPIAKWANALKESSKKNSLKLNTASHNNTSWFTATDGFLEHSPSGGSLYYKGPALQKIIPFWGGWSPLVHKAVSSLAAYSLFWGTPSSIAHIDRSLTHTSLCPGCHSKVATHHTCNLGILSSLLLPWSKVQWQYSLPQASALNSRYWISQYAVTPLPVLSLLR